MSTELLVPQQLSQHPSHVKQFLIRFLSVKILKEEETTKETQDYEAEGQEIKIKMIGANCKVFAMACSLGYFYGCVWGEGTWANKG